MTATHAACGAGRAPSRYSSRVQSTEETGPVPIPWWRFLLMTALITFIYFAVWYTVTPSRTHPAMLLPIIFLGAVLGILVAKWETTGHRDRGGPRRGHRRSASEARWYVFGLAGGGLVLAQMLPATALEWLALGLTALTTGGASHAWVTARHREREAGVR